MVPEPAASSGVPFETSDTIMRRAEFAHVFAALGAVIIMIDMADSLLGTQDEDVAQRFTELARTRYDVRLGRRIEAVTGRAGAVRITLDDGADLDAVQRLLAAVLRRGTGADRQRAVHDRTGDLGAVVRDAVAAATEPAL